MIKLTVDWAWLQLADSLAPPISAAHKHPEEKDRMEPGAGGRSLQINTRGPQLMIEGGITSASLLHEIVF